MAGQCLHVRYNLVHTQLPTYGLCLVCWDGVGACSERPERSWGGAGTGGTYTNILEAKHY